MGNCVPSHAREKPVDENRPATPSAKVVDIEGRLEEFRLPVTAAEVISGHRNCYLCSADAMQVNSNAPKLGEDHLLQPDQIYFLMPLSKLLTPVSLQDLCDLAIKTSGALKDKSGPFLHQYKRLQLSRDNRRN